MHAQQVCWHAAELAVFKEHASEGLAGVTASWSDDLAFVSPRVVRCRRRWAYGTILAGFRSSYARYRTVGCELCIQPLRFKGVSGDRGK